jgi:hypothetical protein
MPNDSLPIKRPKRIATLRLAEPYSVYTVRAWINLSPALLAELRTMDPEKVAHVTQELIVEHNITDFDGNPLPPAGDPTLYAALDPDIYQAIWLARNAEVGRLDPPSAKS